VERQRATDALQISRLAARLFLEPCRTVMPQVPAIQHASRSPARRAADTTSASFKTVLVCLRMRSGPRRRNGGPARRTGLRNHREPWLVRRAPRKGVRAAQTREAAGALGI